MKITKKSFLKPLEMVYPGISKKLDTIQSDCFAFKNGEVFTYNGGLSVRTKSGLPNEWIGAIKARELIEHLRKMKAEEIDVEDQEGLFLVKGKGERIKFLKEKKFQLPVKDVDTPTEWTEINKDFKEGIRTVQKCAGNNEANFVTVCIHVNPKWVEAFDNFQMCRFYVDTYFKDDVIIPKNSIKHIMEFDITHFSETDRWVHFKDENGLIMSCNKASGEFLDITEHLESGDDWTKLELPEGLGEKISSASVSSSTNDEYNQVKVVLDGEKQKVYISGLGVVSDYRGWSSIKYTGKTISFMIDPSLLMDITSRHKKCEITDGRLKVEGDKFVYCTSLSRVIENESDEDEKPKKKKVVKNG